MGKYVSDGCCDAPYMMLELIIDKAEYILTEKKLLVEIEKYYLENTVDELLGSVGETVRNFRIVSDKKLDDGQFEEDDEEPSAAGLDSCCRIREPVTLEHKMRYSVFDQ